VSKTEPPRDAAFEEANSQLNEGLKSCRAVVSSYRALLAPEQDGDGPGDDKSRGDANRSDGESNED
jgi:hypothetical protein